VEERKPIEQMDRPDFESPCTKLDPIVNPAFKKQMDELELQKKLEVTKLTDGTIPIGTSCKNGGCKSSFESRASNDTMCVHHPGTPVFHEGYKFWSCCKKKTTDFSAFLEQVGCETGKHKWIQEKTSNEIACRWDWHQTPAHVVVAIYAKSYDYKKSYVKINPVRLAVKLVFGQNSEFNLDMELKGIVNVSKAEARMYGTKIEITLAKAEPGHWSKLEIPREKIVEEQPQPVADKAKLDPNEDDEEPDVDLDDLEVLSYGAKVTELASTRIE
jgi:cysteine/histidine-rich domain-containing protein